MRSAFSILMPILVVTAPTVALAWGDSETVRGNGEIVTESRKVGEFTSVHAGGGLTVEVRKGAPSLTIETDKNLLEYMRSEVKDGVLTVNTKPNTSIRASKKVKVTITAPSLTGLSASGGVDINVDVPMIKNARIDASGGVQMRVSTIDADSLDLDVSGGVDMTLVGRVNAIKGEFSGGVQLRAEKLAAKTMTVDASGGCDLEVAVAESIQGDLSGGVDLDVHGSPKVSVSKSVGADFHVRN